MNAEHMKINCSLKPLLIAAAILLFLTLSHSYASLGGMVEQFSADNVEIASDGTVMNSAKLHVTKDAMRIDGLPGTGMKGGPKMDLTMLILKKQNKQYIYNHDKKLVFISPVDKENLQAGYKAMGNVTSEKILGKEKVSGYKCVKKEVVTSFGAAGRTFENRLIVWESDKFEFPLRTMDEGGAVQEMRNIKTGKPPKKLFRPLPGYKKVNNMMAVLGMDLGPMTEKMEARQKKKAQKAMPQQNIQNPDMAKIMEQMQKATGNKMKPEEKAQMMQIMAQAMNQAKQTNVGEGASKDLWKIIPKKSGDKVGYEMKIANTIDVICGTQSTLKQVFDFYGNKLKAKDWKDAGTHIQDGQGIMRMTKDGQRVRIAWADKPTDMQGNCKLYYNVHYSGPSQ